MSKEEEKVAEVEQKTKSMNFRINIDVDGAHRSCYMQVTGIPESLPTEYEPTIAKAAEMQFARALNENKFIELYNEGKDATDEQPVFFNIANVNKLQVLGITKVEPKAN